MQTRLTLRVRGGRTHDVEVNAPPGTSLGDVAAILRASCGEVSNAGVTCSYWSGSRTIGDRERLGGPGLRSGCVVGVGEPAPRAMGQLGAIRLQVVGGPDAGRVEPIGRGRLRIGRDPKCELQLTDPDVSREHAELTVTPSGITVRDLGSTNGTRIRSGPGTPSTVAAVAQNLPLGTYVTLGDTTLCVTGVSTPPASVTVGGDAGLLVNRPPRLDVPPPERVDLAPLPALAMRGSVPWVAAIIPALGGVALAWFLHTPQFLAFALLSPLVLLATSLGDRVGSGRGRRRGRAALRYQLTAATAAHTALTDAEIAFRRRSHPDPATLLVTAVTPDARVWERRRDDGDFLDIRVGLGTFPARARVHQGPDVLPPEVLNAVPAVVPIRSTPLGICGPRPLSLPLALWVIGQLAVLHSPVDLRLVALLGDGAGSEWEFLRWLPHIRDSGGGGPRIACTAEDRRRLVAELCAGAEPAAGDPGHRGRPRQPWTVVLVDRCAGSAELGRLTGLLGRGQQAAITAVFLDDDARRLPPVCARTARMTGETGSRVTVLARPDPSAGDGPSMAPPSEVGPIADQVSFEWCDQVARGLAPLRDPGAEHTSGLPTDVRARDLFGLNDLSPNAISERWARAGGRAFTPLAVGAEGTLEIDLGRDGPHALIAGTTGAGKSELLQTLVAGLAVHASPHEVQFVLIDYKGGAAFGVCSRLPHTAGLVTDLDGHLTERALQSLNAELRRRETLFAMAGVAELAAYQRSPVTGEPLGRLVLVVDEFAALAEELPEFVSGLIGIAQRGRSLGVHLILATQRPGGVVSPEIRANTALRIALRVTDPAESSDVIGSDLAASIDQHLPGRAVVRSGKALVPVQVGRVSVPVADDGPNIEVVALDRWGSRLPHPERRRVEQCTDLDVIVACVKAAAATQPGNRPRRPWLDPLPPVLPLASLPAPTNSTAIALGMTDRPTAQAQTPFLLDLADPRTIVITGGPRSGRTSALRAAGVRAADRMAVDDLHIYAIDCAGGGLRCLSDLPHCGAVVSRDAPTSIRALVSRLALELDRRQDSAVNRAGMPPGERSNSRALTVSPPTLAEGDPPALLILLDGWEGFLSAIEDLDAGRTVDTFLAPPARWCRLRVHRVDHRRSGDVGRQAGQCGPTAFRAAHVRPGRLRDRRVEARSDPGVHAARSHDRHRGRQPDPAGHVRP